MKLINKDALVAEIENIRKHYIERDDFDNGWNFALNKVLSFLDTLEVKEVDLEDTMNETKDEAMRDIAWKVHVMISKGKSVSEIDHYVCGICDF